MACKAEVFLGLAGAAEDYSSKVIATEDLAWEAARLMELTIPGAGIWAQRVEAEARPTGFVIGTRLDGEASGVYLRAQRLEMVSQAARLAGCFCSARWLWYLRSVNTLVIESKHLATEISIWRVAENLASGSNMASGSDSPPEDGKFGWAWDPYAAAKVSRLIALARRIDNLEGMIRRSGKSTSFRVTASGLAIVADSDRDLAISEYDDRSLADNAGHWHYLMQVKDTDLFLRGSEVISALKYYQGWHPTMQWAGALEKTKPSKAPGQFELRTFRFDTQKSADFIASSITATTNPRFAAALIVFALAVSVQILDGEEDPGLTLPRSGYLIVARSKLLERIETSLVTARTAAWSPAVKHLAVGPVELLEQIKAAYNFGVQHAAGRLIHDIPNGVVIDSYALTNHLDYDLQINSRFGGNIANFASLDFELVTQRLIDETGYGPPKKIAELRGRTLRLLGKPVTDIDSFMVVDGVLFLVSCKQYTKSVLYDQGDYVSVRNNETKLQEATDEWADRLRTFRDNAVGDNYDFSGFRQLEGIIVTPQVLYTTYSSARELFQVGRRNVMTRRVMSIAELEQALVMHKRARR